MEAESTVILDRKNGFASIPRGLEIGMAHASS